MKDISETKEMIEFANYFVTKLIEARQDDGNIDALEMLDAILEEPDMMINAMWGLWRIPDELDDLSEEEAKDLLLKTLPIVKKLIDLCV